ncbi:MAG TPA: ATP-binding protein, partial [Thermoanaerobaculia bacterium]
MASKPSVEQQLRESEERLRVALEHAQAQQALLDAERLKQSALARLGTIALSNSGLGFLFSRSSEIVRDVLGAEIVEIHKDVRGRLLAVGSSAYTSEDSALTLDLAQHALARRETVLVQRDAEHVAVASDADPGVVAGIVVVIDAGAAERWGALALRFPRAKAIGAADVDFLRALAVLLGQAIERRQTEVAVRLRAVQQTAVAELGRLVSDGVTPDSLACACELIMQGLSTESASVALREGEGFELAAGPAHSEPLGSANTPVHEAFASRRTVVFDQPTASRYSLPGDVRSGVAAPIMAREKCFGVVYAYTSVPRVFTKSDVEFVDAIAIVLAEALDRDEATSALIDSERRFRNVVEGASEIIFSLKPTGEIISLNPAFEAVTGWRPDEWIGRSVFDLFVEEHRAAKLEIFASVLREPRHVRMHAHILAKNGTVLLDVATSPRVVGGEVAELYGFARDITEERRLETRLEQANRLSSLGRLAATVAHEFNNVLMGISPFTEILRREHPSDRASGALDQIGRAVKRGKRITEDILRFAQPAEPIVSSVDVESWVTSLAAEMQTLIGTKYTITTKAEKLNVAADPNQLHQAFLNLILNARDAMPEGGQIVIRAVAEPAGARFRFGALESPESFAHFSVEDEGSGISPDALDHIFEPLFTTKRTGTGLGLPVALQVVERHGGEMFVESELGRGTTFHLFIPLAREAETTEAEREPFSRRHCRNVLLVEDEGAVAAGLAALLESEGIDVRIVGTGREVLPAVDESMPDAVILDIGLPDIDGIAVFTSLSAKYPAL